MATTLSPLDPEAQLPTSKPSPSTEDEKTSDLKHHDHEYRNIGNIITRFPQLVTHLPIYSWAWFLMPQTTLGLSTVLYAQHTTHNFDGLYTLGLIVYFVGLVQFFALVILKSMQWVFIKGTFKHSFLKPEEALFSAAFWIAFYGLITGALDYADPKPGSNLSLTFFGFFWLFLICAVLASIGTHMLLFSRRHLEAKNMTPAWLLPILPVILVGVMAGSFDGHLHPNQIYPALIAGLFCAGGGFIYSLPIAALYLARLFTVGLPVPDTRPGMMIAVGPPCYAPLAFIKLAAGIPKGYGFFQTHTLGAEILQTMALFLSIPMLGFGCMFLLVATCSILYKARSMHFHLTWYGIVFPNVGMVSALGVIAKGIPSLPVTWVFTAGTGILVAIWLFVTVCHIIAIWKKSEYLW